MDWIALIILLSLIQALVFMGLVGAAREKHGIKAPKTAGNEDFERVYRVQQNNLENLIVFLPALWLAATYTNPLIAAALGAVYLVGRSYYAYCYIKEPRSRSVGMVTGFLSTVALIVMGLGGVAMSLFA
jgi:glutathione S-transferase